MPGHCPLLHLNRVQSASNNRTSPADYQPLLVPLERRDHWVPHCCIVMGKNHKARVRQPTRGEMMKGSPAKLLLHLCNDHHKEPGSLRKDVIGAESQATALPSTSPTKPSSSVSVPPLCHPVLVSQ